MTVEEYDPATNTWTPRAPLLYPQGGLAAAAVNGRIYAIGGGTTWVDVNVEAVGSTVVEEYNPPFFDTDGDGRADDEELRYGTDPLVQDEPSTTTPPATTTIIPKPPTAEWICNKSRQYTASIKGLESYSLSFTAGSQDQLIRIKFDVPTGNNIDLMIFDKENYQQWNSRNPFSTEITFYSVIHLLCGVSSGEMEFELRTTQGTLYAVFYNAYSFEILKSDQVDIEVKWCIWMVPSAPPFFELQVQVTDSPTTLEKPFELVITVKNTGDIPAEDVQIFLELPEGLSTQKRTKFIGTLAGMDSQTMLFSLVGDSVGEYTIQVEVTATNVQPNIISKHISIQSPTATTSTMPTSTTSTAPTTTISMVEGFQLGVIGLITIVGFITTILYKFKLSKNDRA